jgi:signal transduction histidine kinase
MWRLVFSKIQYKLIILISLFCFAIFSISGVLHYYYTEDSLDEELGRKLLAVAQAATLQINTEVVSLLREGDERGRTYTRFREKLEDLKNATNVERIAILDTAGRSLLDTDEDIRIGYQHPLLQLNRFEFERTLQGLPSHSVLFESYDGKLYKTAFVPMTVRNEIRGVVAVDGSATFLYLIKRIEFHLITVGVIGVVVSILLAYYFARTISTPVQHLMHEAQRIGEGRLDHPIQVRSSDEVGFLGRTMDAMRENILRRDQYLKTMLAGVAHELRNPLGGIEIYAHLLKKSLNGDSERKQVGKIIHEIDAMKKILSDFQEFAGPQTALPRVNDLEPLIASVRDLFAREISEKKLSFQMKLRQPTLVADAGHLRQVLVNLIENAIHSSNEGGEISIEAHPDGMQCILSIRDRGHGMTGETLERIFDPFFTTKEQGSGLGLAIVKMLVEINNGSIHIFSVPNEGTTCVVKFPRT